MGKHDMPKIADTYKGDFSFQEIYELVRNYLLDQGFVALEEPDFGPDLWETRYLEKGSPTNYIIEWRLQNVISDYYRYILNVDFQGIAISPKEIMWEGRKVKIHSGELSIKLSGAVETDYKKEWEKSWLLKHFAKRYDERIMAKELKEQKDTLFATMNELHGLVRNYFGQRGGEGTAVIEPTRRVS
ncbi:hypothetical protein GF371_04985 [Candidatus Woesearchaeota archaeon]|nr:hypothetical protein [Candidatus Woesearchaeota archaeon]